MKKIVIIAMMLFATVGITNLQFLEAKAPTQEAYVPPVYEGTLEGCEFGYEMFSYSLLAGQEIYAGVVTMSTDGEVLYLLVEGEFDLNAVHVYLYEEGSELPTKRPVPGQAPYVVEDIDGSLVELQIPLTEVSSYTLAVHVAFDEADEFTVSNVAGETAYAANEDAVFTGKGAWFYLVNFEVIECDVTPEEAPTLFIAAHAALTNSETAWALGDTSFIDAGISNKWGWFVDVNQYGTTTFDIYYGAGRNNLDAGTLIGTLTVEYFEEYVVVTYSLTEPLLEEAQLFVGFEAPTSGAPGSYDYKVENLGGVYETQFTVYFEDLI